MTLGLRGIILLQPCMQACLGWVFPELLLQLLPEVVVQLRCRLALVAGGMAVGLWVAQLRAIVLICLSSCVVE